MAEAEETRQDRIARRATIFFVGLAFTVILGIVTLFGVAVFALWFFGRAFRD